MEYKRRLLKSRPGIQKVGNRGNLNHKPEGSKHRRKAAKRRVQREPVMEAGAVVVLRSLWNGYRKGRGETAKGTSCLKFGGGRYVGKGGWSCMANSSSLLIVCHV